MQTSSTTVGIMQLVSPIIQATPVQSRFSAVRRSIRTVPASAESLNNAEGLSGELQIYSPVNAGAMTTIRIGKAGSHGSAGVADEGALPHSLMNTPGQIMESR